MGVRIMMPGARFYYGWFITIILVFSLFICFVGIVNGKDKTIRRMYKAGCVITLLTLILAANSISI